MRYIDDRCSVRPNSQRALKDRNMRRIFSRVATEGAVSRASLARSLGLTPSTVSVLVEEMISRRLIREVAVDVKTAAGRRPVLVAIDPEGMRIPVMSLRREGLLYTLLDCTLSPIESRFETYADVPAEAGWRHESYREISADGIVRAAGHLLQGSCITECWERTQVLCIEFAGTFDWEQGTFSSTSIDLQGSIAFIERLRRMMRNIPVLVCGQTRASGYAEFTASGAMDLDTLYIEMGEGIGASIFLDGKCFVGATDLAGEIGHISLDPNGPRCLCGNRGCLEKLASCAAIRAQASDIRGADMDWELYKAYSLSSTTTTPLCSTNFSD